MLDLHADRYALVADRHARDVESDWTLEAFNEGVASFEEVRSGVAWSIEWDRSPLRAFRLVRPLWVMAHSRHAREIATMCEAALRRWPTGRRAAPGGLGVAAVAHFVSGDPEAARARPRRPSVRRRRAQGRRSWLTAPRRWWPTPSTPTPRPPGAHGARDRGRAPDRRADDRGGDGGPCGPGDGGDRAPGGGIELAESVRDRARRLGSPFVEAWAIYIIGTIVIDEPERAEACFRESLALARVTKYSLTIGNSLRQLGRLAARPAATRRRRAVRRRDLHFAADEDHSQSWDALRSASLLLASRGNRELAARVLASSHRDPRARAIPPLEAPEISALRDELDAELRAAVPARLGELVPLVIDELREAATGVGSIVRRTATAPQRLPPRRRALAALLRRRERPHAGPQGAARPRPPACRAGRGDPRARPRLRRRRPSRRRDTRASCSTTRPAPPTRLASRSCARSASWPRPPTTPCARSAPRRSSRRSRTRSGPPYGLGGRARKAGDHAERARSAVTWRIRSAITRIEAVHPALGRHLKNSVRTGTFCAYTPEERFDWHL